MHLFHVKFLRCFLKVLKELYPFPLCHISDVDRPTSRRTWHRDVDQHHPSEIGGGGGD